LSSSERVLKNDRGSTTAMRRVIGSRQQHSAGESSIDGREPDLDSLLVSRHRAGVPGEMHEREFAMKS
jgi:hypothetical protein